MFFVLLHRRRCCLRIVGTIVALTIFATICVLVDARPAVAATFTRPVPGPIVRAFNLEGGTYSAGHRGIDLAAAVGTPVRAAAAGRVTFAGDVAGTTYLSVVLGNGVETRYGPLGRLLVSAGARVEAGDVLAEVGRPVPPREPHLGFAVVVDGRYADPATYFDHGGIHLRDIEDDDFGAQADDLDAHAAQIEDLLDEIERSATAMLEAAEVKAREVEELIGRIDAATAEIESLNAEIGQCLIEISQMPEQQARAAGKSLLDRLGDFGSAGLAKLDSALRKVRELQEKPLQWPEELSESHWALSWAAEKFGVDFTIVRSLLAMALDTSPVGIASRVISVAAAYDAHRRDCDGSSGVPEQPRLTGTPTPGRKVIAVDGLMSSYDPESSESTDVGGMLGEIGYDAESIVQFSYQGSRDDGTPHAYVKVATLTSLEAHAEALGDQIVHMYEADPTASFDLVGHSQGGVIVAFFLARIYDPADVRWPPIERAVTLDAPLQGVPAAQLGVLLKQTSVGGAVDAAEKISELAGEGFSTEAISQLAETSTFSHKLRTATDFGGVDLTTIGTSTDWIVPAAASDHQAARANVLVDSPENTAMHQAHSGVLHDPEAVDAAARALSGRAPACIGMTEYFGRAATAEAIHWGEQQFAYGAGFVANYFDAKKGKS